MMERFRATPINYGKYHPDALHWPFAMQVYPAAMRLWTQSQVLDTFNQYGLKRNKSVVIAASNCSELIIEDRAEKVDLTRFNKVWHRKSQVINRPYLLSLTSSRGESYLGSTRMYYREPQAAVAPLVVDETILQQVSIDQFRSRAWASMQPRFHGDVSLINSLFELKDFKDIAKYLLANTHYFDEIRKFRRMFLKSGTKRAKPGTPWFDPTIPASKAVLTWNFAIVPVILDISAILLQMKSVVEDEQSKFALAGQVEQTSHYSEITVHEDTRRMPTTGDYVWQQNGQLYKTKLTATLKYKYDYKMRRFINALRMYWGLTGNVKAFWDMIPFSFLVDYVLQVGQAIHFAERDPNVTLLPNIYGESYKITHETGKWFRDDSRLIHTVLDGNYIEPKDRNYALITGVSTSVYHRQSATPFKGLIVPRFKTPSTRQLLNVAALARLLFA